jgi:GNAT superfamily N-acetyltransferase
MAAVIEGPDGKILGSIGVMAMRAGWYSNAWAIIELWLFVRPECRKGTGYGDALMAWLKRHQREMSERVGYEMMCVTGPTSHKRLASKERWWGKHGRKIGALFVVAG